LFSKLVPTILALLLLFETVGVTEFNSRCPYSGETNTQYVFYSCCCSGESKGCCELEVELLSYKADCFSQCAELSFEAFDCDIDAILADWTFQIEKKEVLYKLEVGSIYDPPPRWKNGKSILIENETFLI